MIDTTTRLCLYLSLALSIIVPVGLVTYGFIQKKLKVLPFAIGLAMFLLLRTFVLSPIAGLLGMIPGISDLLGIAFFSAMVTALLLTIVDVYGKKLIYKYYLKENIDSISIWSLALGQGVTEVLFTISWRLFNCFSLINLIEKNQLAGALAETYSAEEIAAITADTLAISWDAYLYLGIGALSILFVQAITAHLVGQSMKTKDNRFILFAIAFSLIFNCLTYSLPLVNYLLTVLALIVFGVVAGWFFMKEGLFDLQNGMSISEKA